MFTFSQSIHRILHSAYGTHPVSPNSLPEVSQIDTSGSFDPIQVQVWRHLLSAVAEEMGAALERTAYSPNIKERLDHSCALFDARGRLLAQAAHIPVHLGAMPLMLQTLLTTVSWSPGTMWLCNDPRFGGTHLPDLTLVAPVYHPVPPPQTRSGRPRLQCIGFVASRAHHADIGGISPGSLPLSTEIFQEGLILSPIRLMRRGKVQEEALRLVCANSRTPFERRGDLQAQIAANETGIRRLQALYAHYGVAEFNRSAAQTLDYAAMMIRRTLAALPPGTYQAVDYLEDDGAGTQQIPIQVTVHLDGSGEIVFDFAGSAPSVRGSLNATEAITLSACYYLVRCLVEEDIPTNAGCFAPVKVHAPQGSIVNSSPPAAVAGGNVETSQRIVDVLLKALAQAAPDRIPAASQGTMNNLTIGGWDSIRNRPFAYYETIAGGAGASASGPGASAVHTHMTNTRNTPIEALESHYPLRVDEYSLRTDAIPNGLHSGGAGVVRRITLLSDAQVSLLSERRVNPPWGANGGGNGNTGSALWIEKEGDQELLPGKFSRPGAQGDAIEIRTPCGGGWGNEKNIKKS